MILITDDNKDILVLKQAIKENQPLDNFNTSKVTDMRCMFDGTTSMFIGYIMRFASKVIFVYKNYDAMDIKHNQFFKFHGIGLVHHTFAHHKSYKG